MATTEPIRSRQQLKALADYFLQRGQFRNYALVIMGAYMVLRISDLLRLKWSDVYDEDRQIFYSHVYLYEKKTGKKKQIALNEQVLKALDQLLPHRHGSFIFANNRKDDQAISRVQAWRIIQAAAKEVGITGTVACHGLRKTWGYHAWTSGKVSPVVIMHIYNHSNFAVTKRYLGVEQDDMDKAHLSVELL